MLLTTTHVKMHIIIECINVCFKRRSQVRTLKVSIKSPPTKQQFSTPSNKVTSGQGICYLCKCIDKQENVVAAVTLYATKAKTQIDHVKGMRANWTEMAKVLQDGHLLI